jgi:hypothetical protein
MAAIDISTITVAAQPAVLGDCGLCLRQRAGLHAAVVVSHGMGTVARFEACEFCERALRRLIAVSPGFGNGQGATLQTGIPAETVVEVLEVEGPVVPIHEYPHPIQDGDGSLYVPVVVGVQRTDATWAGWIEFREIGGTRVLRTNRETTQPNQGALAYWASGLQPSYLEGAFKRAARPHTVRVP